MDETVITLLTAIGSILAGIAGAHLKKLSNMDKKIDRIEHRLAAGNDRFEKMEEKINDLPCKLKPSTCPASSRISGTPSTELRDSSSPIPEPRS